MGWHFNESTDQYVTLGYASALVMGYGYGNYWTLAGWFKLDDNVGTVGQYFFSWGGAGANPSLNLFVVEASNSSTAERNKQHYYVSLNNVSGAATPGADTAWHHVLLVHDATGLKVYLDGEADATIGFSGGIDVTDAPLYFGMRSDANEDRCFGGWLGEWAKWNRALDADERASLAGGTLPSSISSGLTWYIDMYDAFDCQTGSLTVTNNNATVSTATHPISYVTTYQDDVLSNILTQNLSSDVISFVDSVSDVIATQANVVDAKIWTEEISGGGVNGTSSIDALIFVEPVLCEIATQTEQSDITILEDVTTVDVMLSCIVGDILTCTESFASSVLIDSQVEDAVVAEGLYQDVTNSLGNVGSVVVDGVIFSDVVNVSSALLFSTLDSIVFPDATHVDVSTISDVMDGKCLVDWVFTATSLVSSVENTTLFSNLVNTPISTISFCIDMLSSTTLNVGASCFFVGKKR